MQKGMKQKTSSINKGYGVFLIPGITAFLIILIIPFLSNVGISFTKWGGVRAPVWIGLSNYQQLIGDSVFWLSFRNNLILLLAHDRDSGHCWVVPSNISIRLHYQ